MLVNEIFYSLQGEGYHAGTPAIFVRFSGCNLRCPFCDTQHEHGTEMSEEAIVAAARNLRPPTSDLLPNLVVFTGGEPALQLTPSLVELFHDECCYMVAVETNGTLPLPGNVDWVTLSPKSLWLGEEAAPVLTSADELKVLFDGEHDPAAYDHIVATRRFLQPMDTGDAARNAALMRQAADYCLRHPWWSLSLQIHKILDIP